MAKEIRSDTGLRRLNAEDTDQRRQKQNKRNQEDAAPRQAEKRGPEHFPGSLHHHVADRHPRRQRKRQALEPQRGAADANHLRIPAEQLDQERRRKEFGDGEHDQKNRRDFDAEAERPLDPIVKLCSVIESADRLEPLPETDQDEVREMRKARNDRHRRNGGVPGTAAPPIFAARIATQATPWRQSDGVPPFAIIL